MNSDWLDQPAEATDSPVAVRPNVPMIEAEQDAKLVASYAALSLQQQMLLQALQDNYFNFAKANAALPTKIDRKTYWRWRNNDNEFAYAVMILKARAVEAIDSHRPLLRIAEIAEDALEPKDVYFKGEPTGEQRPDYTAALRATELQMRHKKQLGNADEEKGGFGGRNITLAVQVIMPGGELKDVTRKGVTIDVPVVEITP